MLEGTNGRRRAMRVAGIKANSVVYQTERVRAGKKELCPEAPSRTRPIIAANTTDMQQDRGGQLDTGTAMAGHPINTQKSLLPSWAGAVFKGGGAQQPGRLTSCSDSQFLSFVH